MAARPAVRSSRARIRPIAWTGGTIAICSALLLILATLLGIYQMLPPRPLAADAAVDSFSAGRAMSHVTAIAREPHPTGTPAIDEVRAYIQQQLTDLGLNPEIQRATAVNDTFRGQYLAANVVNVVARLPGEDSSRAIMLVGHYDSVPTGPGAADDGHAVALLLETARALKAGPKLKNDVIFLFTDGEELGMLGAEAFSRENPLAKNVGFVMNFEARGTGGPVIMYETSPNAGALLREYGKAAPYPMASSLATAIYRMMPNGSDFSAFLDAGMPGLNFAFIDGAARYHTTRDDVAHLDRGSLQMAGANTLAIVRHFGGLDLTQLTGSDSVYFNPIRFALIRYPISFALPLAIVLGLALIGLLVWGVRRRKVRLAGVGLGFLAPLSGLALAAIAVLALGTRVEAPYYGGFANLGLTGLGILLAASAIALFRRWARLTELVAGGLSAWLIVLIFISRALPEASYMIAWPLVFGLAAFAWLLRMPEPERPSLRDWGVLALFALVPILGVVSLLYLAFVALPLMFGAWITLAVVLLAFLVTPHVFWVVSGIAASAGAAPAARPAIRRLVLPAIALATVAMFVAGALIGPSYSHPRRDSVYYGLNTTTGKAVFGSSDASADPYTGQLLGPAPRTGKAITDAFRPEEQMQADAPVLNLPAPVATVVEDRIDQSTRTLRLQISSQRQAAMFDLVIDDQSEVTAVSVNGQPVRAERWPNWPWEMVFFGAPADGMTLEVQMPAGQQLVMRVTDATFELPELPGATIDPRPAQFVPGWPGDTTQVAAIFRFWP